MSVLERMYTFAKSVGAGARENFTTEAMAGAIRSDPRPFVQFLQEAGELPPGELTEVDLETQVVLPGTGVLDMVFSCAVARRRHELWIEVKVLAAESGTQLDAYLRHISRIPEDIRPTLLTLARRPLRAESEIPFLSWHALRRKVETSSSPAWRDFAEYLSEIRMSHDFDEPIAEREAAALNDFRLLHGKVGRIIVEAAAVGAKRWPSLPWPTREDSVRNKILERLGTHQQLIIGVPPANRARGVWLTFGADLRAGEARLHVAVETWPSAYDTQRIIIDLADRAAFAKEWNRSLGAWGGVKRTDRLIDYADQVAASAWLVDRFKELHDAGILAIVAGAAPAVSDLSAVRPVT